MANIRKEGEKNASAGNRQRPTGEMSNRGQLPSGGMQGMLSHDLPEGEALVWVKTKEFIKPKKIKTGLTDGNYTVILEGLEEGDELVTGEVIQKKEEQKKQQSPFMPSRPGRK